jgi:hypothetical protein
MEKVMGIGGLFFRAHDPKALGRWYQQHLGISPALSSYEDSVWQQEAGPTVFAPLEETSDYFGDAAMAGLAGTTLLWRGTALDRAWALNPRAYSELAPFGAIVSVPFLLLSVTLFAAGIGWFNAIYGDGGSPSSSSHAGRRKLRQSFARPHRRRRNRIGYCQCATRLFCAPPRETCISGPSWFAKSSAEGQDAAVLGRAGLNTIIASIQHEDPGGREPECA